MSVICSVCHNSVNAYRIGVTHLQIAQHTVNGARCAGSGMVRAIA